MGPSTLSTRALYLGSEIYGPGTQVDSSRIFKPTPVAQADFGRNLKPTPVAQVDANGRI
jgi:hypothetical protein